MAHQSRRDVRSGTGPRRPAARWGLVGSALATVLALASIVVLGVRIFQQPARGVAPAVQTALPGLIWSDEFDGAAGGSIDSAAWTAAEGAGGWGNNELQNYTGAPGNLSLDGDGHLALSAQRQATTDRKGRTSDYTSARIESVPTADLGRIEARILVPSGAGLWSAFWTLGADHARVGWPSAGEIDVLETMNDTATVSANVHATTRDASGRMIGSWQRQRETRFAEPVGGSWHTYAVERRAGELRFLIDGAEVHRVRQDESTDGQDWPFDQPQRILLDLAVGGDWPGPPDSTTPFPATMLVDYVRVFDTSVLDW